MKGNYICALDLGSSKIAAGLACVSRKGQIINLLLESGASRGINRSRITDQIELSHAISGLLERIKTKSGINVKSIYLNCHGQDIVTKHSQATIALAERGNKLITKMDTQRVIEEARILGSNLEEEIIHQMPLSFKVDDQDSVTNPGGLYGHSLGVDLYLVCVNLSYIQTISRLLDQIGYGIKDLFLSGIVTSKVIFNPGQLKKGLNIFCDIGSDITQIYLFKDGNLNDIQTLPLGGNDLTYELAGALKVPFELAEEIKKSYATIGQAKDWEDKEVIIKKDIHYSPVSRRQICEIVTEKANALIETMGNCISNMRSEFQNLDNLLVGGRTIIMDGFLETMETRIGTPVKMIRFSYPDIFNQVKDKFIKSTSLFLNYATTLGLIYEAIESARNRYFSMPLSQFNPLQKIIYRAKEVYQEYF